MKRIFALLAFALLSSIHVSAQTVTGTYATATATYSASGPTISVTYTISGDAAGNRGRVYFYRTNLAGTKEVDFINDVTPIYAATSKTVTFVATTAHAVGDPTKRFFIQTQYVPGGSAASYGTPVEVNTTTQQPQTVTVSPASVARIVYGDTKLFTASGGSTSYVWAATGGTLTGSGATRTFTAGSVAGTFSVTVYASSTAAYLQSNTASASVVVVTVDDTPPERRKYSFRVYSAFDKGTERFKATDVVTGQVLGSVDITDGGSAILQVIKVGNNDVRLTSEYITPVTTYTRFSDGSIGETTWPAGGGSDLGVTPDSSFQPSSVSYVPAVSKTSPLPTTPPTTSKIVDSSTASLATPTITQGNAAAVQWSSAGGTGGLTDAAYKEGVGALATELQAINKKLAASSGSTGGSSGSSPSLDRIANSNDAILNELTERRNAEKAETQGIKDATANEQANFGASLQEALDAGQAFGDVVTQGRSVSSVTVNVAAPNADGWTISDQNLGMISLNPFQNSRVPAGFRDLAAWVRNIVGWAVVLALTGYAYEQMRKAMVDLMQIPQHKFVVEQVVQGSMWTTLTTWLARAAVRGAFVAFLLALPTACIQIFSTEWSQIGLTFAASISSGSAAGGGDGGGVADFIALANCVIPVATILSAGATYAAIEFGLINLQSIWMVTFRLFK